MTESVRTFKWTLTVISAWATFHHHTTDDDLQSHCENYRHDGCSVVVSQYEPNAK